MSSVSSEEAARVKRGECKHAGCGKLRSSPFAVCPDHLPTSAAFRLCGVVGCGNLAFADGRCGAHLRGS